MKWTREDDFFYWFVGIGLIVILFSFIYLESVMYS